MKRALFGMAVALCLGLAGISDVHAQGVTLGAQAGYNYAQLSDVPTDIESVGDKGTFVFGAFANIQFHPMLFVGVEGLYSERKTELTEGGEVNEFKQAHFEVPAYLGVRLMSGMFQPVLYAGASAAFESKCEVSAEGTTVDCSDPLVDISTKSALWSGVFGGGLDVALGSIVLTGDIRYNLGLSKIVDEEGEDTKWNSWMFLVGVGFKLGA
ncbi:MAG: porin family protein [Gemmatimonadales bacterium]|jgi:hypothetical protein